MKITYVYENESKNRLIRTFSIKDIKEGVDDAHLALIPGYRHIGILSEVNADIWGALDYLVRKVKDDSRIDIVKYDDVLGVAEDALALKEQN